MDYSERNICYVMLRVFKIETTQPFILRQSSITVVTTEPEKTILSEFQVYNRF